MELSKVLEGIDAYIKSVEEIISENEIIKADETNPNCYIEISGRLTGLQIAIDYLEAVRMEISDAISNILDNSINTNVNDENTILKAESIILNSRIGLLEKENNKLKGITEKNKTLDKLD